MEEAEIEVVLNLGKLTLHRWRKNGDHPDDRVGEYEPDPGSDPDENGEVGKYRRQEGAVVRYFRRPDVPGMLRCPRCEAVWHLHGWIDSGGPGRVVCPGDWVGRLSATASRADYYAFPDHLVRAVRELPFDLVVQSAREAVEDIGAREEVGDDSTAMGLVLATAAGLGELRGLREG